MDQKPKLQETTPLMALNNTQWRMVKIQKINTEFSFPNKEWNGKTLVTSCHRFSRKTFFHLRRQTMSWFTASEVFPWYVSCPAFHQFGKPILFYF